MLQVKDYKVKWRHELHTDSTKKMDGQRNRDTFKAITECYLYTGDKRLDIGLAGCSWEDNFSRDTGRKVSLKRAIATLPKKDRTMIWEAYRIQMTKAPRW